MKLSAKFLFLATTVVLASSAFAAGSADPIVERMNADEMVQRLNAAEAGANQQDAEAARNQLNWNRKDALQKIVFEKTGISIQIEKMDWTKADYSVFVYDRFLACKINFIDASGKGRFMADLKMVGGQVTCLDNFKVIYPSN